MLPRPPLAVSLAGFSTPQGAAAGPRGAIDWAAAAGFAAVQLDATVAGLRPRELDRSARRDLAAILRRAGMALCGLDLWIPPEHLMDAARADRASEAIGQAAGLASDLVRAGAGPATPAISVTLPDGLPAEILAHLSQATERVGVALADHTPRVQPPAMGIRAGIDPAAMLLAGLDPAAAAARAGELLASARWSDASSIGRVLPGAPGGRLDVDAYVVSLSVAGYTRPVVLDLRGLADQAGAVRATLAAW